MKESQLVKHVFTPVVCADSMVCLTEEKLHGYIDLAFIIVLDEITLTLIIAFTSIINEIHGGDLTLFGRFIGEDKHYKYYIMD